MAFFDTIAQLYNAARGVIPFGKDTATGLPVPLEVSATGRLLVDADIAAGGALATETTLSSVDTKLTTITGHVDGVEGLLGGTEVAFGVVQTWSNQAAMTEPPTAWIAVQQLGAIEILFVPGMTFTGSAVEPTDVRFRVWVRDSEGGTPREFKIDEFVIPAATLKLSAATNPLLPKRYNTQTNEMAVTVTFLDGTSPVINGSVVVRPIAQQARDDSTIRRDPTTGNPIAQSPAYDGLTGADKAALINDLYPALPEVGVISETSRTSGSTYYWPSSDGIEMGNGYDTLGIQFSITGATTSATSTTIEGTINGTTWENITLGTLDCTTGATLSGAITTTGGGNVAKLLAVYGAGVVSKIRVAVAVTTANTGAVSASFRRLKAGGGMR